MELAVFSHWFAETSGFFGAFLQGWRGKGSVEMGVKRSKGQNKAAEASTPRNELRLVEFFDALASG